jgi:hypothetical protein
MRKLDLRRILINLVVLAAASAVAFLGGMWLHYARARDLDGHYAQQNPELHQWFNSLASDRGLCCSFADGVKVEDVDWDSTAEGKYRVRLCVSR